ncbi:MAG: hypothetical protein AAGG53_00605 [Cyanobacteria bacterium P01_H01_bin.152]
MHFRFRLSILLLGLISPLVLSCSVQADSPSILGAEVVPPMFEAIYQEVLDGSDIPMLLPTTIPEAVLREPQPGQTQPFFVSSDEIDIDRYEVNLDGLSGCEGAGYCTFGLMGAERVTSETPSVDERYAFMLDPKYQPIKRSEEPISTVELSGALTGTFIPWVCGANCNAAKVYWQQGDIRYYVGIRGPIDQATVVAIANSMIENQPDAIAPDSE